MTRWPTASSASRATTARRWCSRWENLDNAAARLQQADCQDRRPEARRTARWTKLLVKELQGEVPPAAGQRPEHLHGRHRPVRRSEGQDQRRHQAGRSWTSFDQVLSLTLLEKAAALRDAQRQGSERQGRRRRTLVEPARAIPLLTRWCMQRYEAKKAKNFAEADRIRDELKAQGIEITDTKDGASWKRV